ncbi:winged helix-turn-helix domain-containing protein [Paenibacillus pabuli]
MSFEARHTWILAIFTAWIERQYGKLITEKGVSKLLTRLELIYTKDT